MRKLFKHRVEIYMKPVDRSWHKDCFIIENVEILARNDSYTVLNDYNFTKLDNKGKGYAYHNINKECINIRTNDKLLGNGVFYTLYSEKKRRPSTIRKHIEKKIKAQFGWLLSDVDLSIIK